MDEFLKAIADFVSNLQKTATYCCDYITETFAEVIKKTLEFVQTVCKKLYFYSKRLLIDTFNLLVALLRLFLYFFVPIFIFALGRVIVEKSVPYSLNFYCGVIFVILGGIGEILFILIFASSILKIYSKKDNNESQSGSSGEV